MFGEELIATMRRGAYLVNTARALIVDRDAVVRALESGQLAGYAGDVWYPQPAPADHPWRTMPHHGMTHHISGSSLSAQARYAAGTREILESLLRRHPDPRRVPHRRRRQARRCRSALLQRSQLTHRARARGAVPRGAPGPSVSSAAARRRTPDSAESGTPAHPRLRLPALDGDPLPREALVATGRQIVGDAVVAEAVRDGIGPPCVRDREVACRRRSIRGGASRTRPRVATSRPRRRSPPRSSASPGAGPRGMRRRPGTRVPPPPAATTDPSGPGACHEPRRRRPRQPPGRPRRGAG